MPNEYLLTALRAALALLLILSLGGLTGAWMPSFGFMVVVLAGLHVLSRSRGRRLDRQAAGALWQRHGFAIGLTAIALFGLCFRLMDAGHGLWHVDTDIDERRLADSVLHFFRTGEIDHSTVEHYPGLHFWLLTGSFLLTFLYALMSGVARSLDAMPWEMFVWAGRATNAFVETGAIALTGLIGRAVSGRTAGLLAALVFAVSPVSVEISTHLRNEAGLTFFIVAATYASVVAYRRPTIGMGLLSGALGGFAMAVKYSGLFAWMPALVAAALAPREVRLRQLALATAGFGVALAATNHFIWADFPNFVHQLSTEVAMTGANHWSAQTNPGWFYVDVLANWSVGWPLLITAAGAGAWALAARNRYAWILLSFPLPYVWFMTKQPAQFSRWVYPLTPFVALAGVVGMLYLAGVVARRVAGRSAGPEGTAGPEGPAYMRRRARLAATATILIGILPPVWLGARQFSRRLVAPTYAHAEAWLAANAAPDDRILSEHRWLWLEDVPGDVTRVWNLPQVLAGAAYQLYEHDWIVVPEPYYGVAGLDRLTLAREFRSDQGFGGTRGISFRIYTPKPMPLLPAVDIDPASASADPFLGVGWLREPSNLPGVPVPQDGGNLYVPSPAQPGARVDIELATEGALPAASGPVLHMTVGGHEVGVRAERLDEHRLRLVSDPLPSELYGDRITVIRLSPADPAGGDVRVLRFSVR